MYKESEENSVGYSQNVVQELLQSKPLLVFADLQRVQGKIRKFQNEFLEEFNVGKKPKEVYRLALQLFPLTKKA